MGKPIFHVNQPLVLGGVYVNITFVQHYVYHKSFRLDLDSIPLFPPPGLTQKGHMWVLQFSDNVKIGHDLGVKSPKGGPNLVRLPGGREKV